MGQRRTTSPARVAEARRVGRRLRRLATSKSLSVDNLAGLLEISVRSVNRHLNGERKPQPETLGKYAKVLDVGVAKLTQPATTDEDMTSAPTEIMSGSMKPALTLWSWALFEKARGTSKRAPPSRARLVRLL